MEIIAEFEPSTQGRKRGQLGIDGKLFFDLRIAYSMLGWTSSSQLYYNIFATDHCALVS